MTQIMAGEIGQVILVIGIAFAVAAVAIFIAGLFVSTRQVTPDLWRAYASEFLLVGALVIPAALGPAVFGLFLLAVMLRGEIELGRAFGARDLNLPQVVSIATGTFLLGLFWIGYGLSTFFVLAGGVVLVLIAGIAASGRLFGPGARAAMIGLFFPILCCATGLLLAQMPEGFVWIVVTFAIVEINDAVALLAGKLIGTKRIFPKLSPGKTAEGLAAGLIVGFVAGTAMARYLIGLPHGYAMAFALLVLAAGLAGDLGTSALKRARRVKDFAPVLKRHGGILDIYDAFLAAMPIAWLFKMLNGF